MATILVVDDTVNFRESLEELLEFAGYEAIGAADGREGVELAQAHHPDLILSDIIMPELDGYELLAEVRQDPSLVSTPIIFYTVKAEPAEIRRGLAMGVSTYLTKPCQAETLLSTIRHHLNRQN